MSPFIHQTGVDEPIDVLLVEDDPRDVGLLREAFEKAKTNREIWLHAVASGSDALSYLCQSVESDSGPPPNFVLLDLDLPTRDGVEILEAIVDDPKLRRLSVVILTESDRSDDIVRCYEARANAYLTKPTDLSGYVSLVGGIEWFWLEQAKLPSISA
ncbi:response regulator receiver protein [Haloterrigena salina JCM 13891]|uniref:Response regulator receiver protein n=1 Tax=Haloterrigena salina JCM 13891 TaxID=1227488 RepID=M0BV83_9EURY|nr:response regulator [Haloterrigena salina]ELZ14936.1 response regulator receiver protein [Haloterrigena salina JCM 13891]